MSYTTKGMPQGVPVFETNLIHEAMIGELVAINDYAKHIANSNAEEINEVLEHIMEDEKRHYGMLLELLRRHDATQMYMFEEAKGHVDITVIPFHNLYTPEYSSNLILNSLRKDIKGELESIIVYENHVVQITTKEIKEVFVEIIGDEKEHVEELTMVLQKYDPHSYGPIDTRNQ